MKFQLTEMTYERQDAINRCANLGTQFIKHFDKLYKDHPNSENYNHHCLEMQNWFNEVSKIVLKQNKKLLSNNQLIDWFFTAGSSVEYLFDTEEEQNLYDNFIIKVLSSKGAENNIQTSFEEVKLEN